MTDAPTAFPESIPFTGHELVALLGLADTPAAATTRRLLEFPDVDEAHDLNLMGLTTLLVRDFATLTDEQVEPTGPARHVAVALTTATRWLRAAAMADSTAEFYAVLASPTATVALRARPLGIFEVTPLSPGTDLTDLAVSIVRDFTEGTDKLLLSTVTIDEEGRAGVSASLESGPGDVWRLSDLHAGDSGEFTINDVPRADALGELARVLAADGSGQVSSR